MFSNINDDTNIKKNSTIDDQWIELNGKPQRVKGRGNKNNNGKIELPVDYVSKIGDFIQANQGLSNFSKKKKTASKNIEKNKRRHSRCPRLGYYVIPAEEKPNSEPQE